MTQKKKGKSSTQKSPRKEKNGGGSDAAGLRLDEEAMAKIVGEVVSQLTPILVKTITTAISVCMTYSMTKDMKKIEKEQATQRQYIQQQSLNAIYKRDKLEQYDRRLNIIITGEEEREHEAVEDKCVLLDISRDIQSRVMKNKQKLRGKKATITNFKYS